MDSRRSLLHPRKIGLGWQSRGSPIYSAGLESRAASLTPVAPKSANDCFLLFGVSLHVLDTGSATTLDVWKFIKRRALYGRYHPNFADFRGAIEETLDGLSTTHAERLKTLVTLNFQQFEDVSIMAA
jgi:hypothetical protein